PHGDQPLSSATVQLRSRRMAPLTLDILIGGPPPPSLPSRFCPTGKCLLTWSKKSLLMPPFNVFAETSALASGGRAMVTPPLIDLSETALFTSAKVALTEPLTVDNATLPASPRA